MVWAQRLALIRRNGYETGSESVSQIIHDCPRQDYTEITPELGQLMRQLLISF
jgi:hypothetical protein